MKLATKLGAGLLILVTVTATLSWSQMALIRRMHDESRELSRISFEATSLSLGLRGRAARLRELGLKFLVLRDAAYGTEVERERGRLEADLGRLQAFELTAAEGREVERLTLLWRACVAAVEDDPAGRDVLTQRRAALDDAFDALNGQLERLAEVSRQAVAMRVAAAGARVEKARRIAWAGTVAGLLAAVAISLAVVRSLVRPLRRLGHGTRVLAEGDFEHRVPAEGGPELAALAEDFNDMARQLSQLDRLKKDFLANVSHDLKTPLASMQEATRLLLEEIPGPLEVRQRRLLSLNLKSGERLFRMIDDLLHLSRLAAGTVEISPRRQDLVDLARAALDEITALAGDAELELEEDFPRQPVMVACDGPAVHKVLQNLLSNAVKYTPEGGMAGIRIRPLAARSDLPAAVRDRLPGDDCLPAAAIEVWDTGPGVPDDHRRRIFERFVRVDSGAGPPGTGLGLAIAREIVTAHGGELWVEDRPQQGSVFRAILWSQPPAKQVPEAAGSGAANAGAGKRRTASSWAALALVAAVGLAPFAGCARPSPVVQVGSLEIGDVAFDRGDYAAASDAYQDHLDRGSPAATDRVLFRLALMYVLPSSEVHDPRRARKLLGELIERFPQSPYRGAAAYLLGLQREVQLLRRQLEEIKRIDLGGSGS